MTSQVEKDDLVKAAMRAELGLGRLEDLHMEDGEGRSSRVYNHPPPLASSSRPTSANNKWSQAIARGDFNDDDAAQVSGMDAMQDGNLARMRRAARTAYSHVSQNYTESSLSRDRNGLVAPRTSFPGNGRGGRFVSVPGPHHVGDEPIDIEATLSGNARRSAPAIRDPGPRRLTMKLPPTQPSASVSVRQTSLHSSAADVQTLPPPVRSHSVSDQVTSPAVQNTQPAAKVQMHVELPEGASVLLQLPVTIKSTSFRGKAHPGTVTLISGCKPSDDLIVLSVDDENVTDARYNLSEYTDYMNASSQDLMLAFQVSGGMKLFYAVHFGSAESMASFIESLRKHVDRPRNNVQCLLAAPREADEGTEISMTTADIEYPQPAAVASLATTKQSPEVAANNAGSVQGGPIDIPAIEEPASVVRQVFPTISKTAATVAAASPLVAAAGIPSKESSKEPDSTFTVTDSVIENMVKWVMDTARYLRDCSPEEFGFDTMRSIIRATAAAIMTQHYPPFASMSIQQRLHIVEEQCRPAVERGFLRELSKDPTLVAQLAGSNASPNNVDQSATDSQPLPTQQNGRVHVNEPQNPLTEPSRSIYTIDELLSLRATAVEPPNWLPEMGSPKEARQPKQLGQGQHSLPNLENSDQPHLTGILGQTRQRCFDVQTPTVINVLSTDGASELPCQDAQTSNIGDGRNYQEPSHIHWSANGKDADGMANVSTMSSRANIGCNEQSASASGATSSSPDISESPHDQLATFLSGGKPDSKKMSTSPPSGLWASRHSHGNPGHLCANTGQFSGNMAQTSSYTQELVSLVESDDEGQKVAQTTEDFRRLSLGS